MRGLEKQGLEVVNIRLVKEPTLYGEESLTDTDQTIRFMQKYLSDFDREIVCVLNLNTHNEVLSMNVVSMGTINQALVSPRDVFKAAILSNACGVILFHNHPSGRANPSAEDLTVTRKLLEAGRALDIEVLDHIIVGGYTGASYSFRGHDLMDAGELEKRYRKKIEERYCYER